MPTVGVFLRRVRALVADKPTAFVWVYDGKLAGSGYPASKGQVAWLGRQGIDSILTVMEDPLPTSYLRQSMHYLHVMMRDHDPPEQGSLDAAAGRIETELKSGRVLLVHCQAGRGRTMCVIAAHLIKNKGMGADEALAFLRKLRPGAVEPRQETSLREFARRIHGP